MEKKVLKRVLIFVEVLVVVLLLGGVVLHYFNNANEKNKILVRDEKGLFNIDKVEYILAEDIFHMETVYRDVEEVESDEVQEESRGELLYREALAKGEKVYRLDAEREDEVTLLFAGDVLLDPEYAVMHEYNRLGRKIEEVISADLLEKMKKADLFMINNEFTFTDRGEATKGKSFTFRAHPSDVSVLHEMGVDIVSLANNHAYDYGEISLLDTLDTLDAAGIARVGAGRDLQEAMQPVYYIANDMKIAIVSATQMERFAVPDTKGATENSAGVFRCMEEENLVSVLQEAKRESDYVILFIHWGTENQEDIDWWQQTQSKTYVNAGADAIIGGHPHILQKLDLVNGVPVVYSLGNFWFNSKTVDTCAIELKIGKTGLKSMRFYPCIQSDKKTSMLKGDEAEALLEYIRRLSPSVDIDEEGYIYFG